MPAVTSAGITASVVAIISAVISALVAVFVSWLTARNTLRIDRNKRQSDLALRIADTLSQKDEELRRGAARRFAVGMVKVLEPAPDEESGKVYFVPMNSRVTVGREADNDIVFEDIQRRLSRWHCGFVANQHAVWIEDYASTNGTHIDGKRISGPQKLTDGAVVSLGPYNLVFRTVHENTILSQ